MFGGLELKDNAASGVSNASASASSGDAAAATGTDTSSFSFMQSSNKEESAAEEAPTASGFGFLSATAKETTTTTTTTVDDDTKKEAPAAASSGFSFLAPSAATTTTERPPVEAVTAAPPSPGAPSSSFGFLSSMAPASPVPVAPSSQPPSSPAPSGSSMFEFLSSVTSSTVPPPAAPVSPVPTMSSTSYEPSSRNSHTEESSSMWGAGMTVAAAPASSVLPPSDLLATHNEHQPVGAGMVFAGAVTAGTVKRPAGMKKRRPKTKTIGAGLAQQQAPQSLHMPELPVASPPSPPPPSKPTSLSLQQEVQEAAKKVEQTIREKQYQQQQEQQQQQQQQQQSTSFAPPSLPEEPKSPQDETYQAAKAQAVKAKHQMGSGASPSKPPSGKIKGTSLMKNLFQRPKFFTDLSQPNIHNSTTDHGGRSDAQMSSSSQESSMSDGYNTNHHDVAVVAATETATSTHAIQKEQEEVQRAMAEQELAAAKRWKQQQELEETRRVEQEMRQRQVAEEQRRREEEAAQRQREREAQEEEERRRRAAPAEQFQRMLVDLEGRAKRSTERVAQLRHQRAALLGERTFCLKNLRLASQLVQQAEVQQSSAVESEDFELAERLGTVIQTHTLEVSQFQELLQKINMALSELESQKKSVILAVCESFSILQTQLESFQIEQSNMERDDGSEAMERFAATSKVLWAENERLNNEVKHVERDESLVKEERNELESSISEQTSEMEQTRDTASTELNVVNEEIEELKRLLAEKESVASELTVQVAEQEASIHRVRTKFSRQLNKIYKKEATVNENRNEWETEKSAYDQMKEEHEAMVKSHSEALLAHEDMMSRLQHEIDSAQSMEKVIRKEIQFDNASLDDGANTNDDDNNEEIAKVQAQVVECEAAVDEANQVLVLATGIISGLKEEIRGIDTQIPSLEESKKSAAVKRDFRAAGKAAKQIKEMMARKETCEEELEFEAADRLKAAQDSLQEADEALAKQQAIAHEQEKKHGIACMARLAKKIKRLEQKRLDSNHENTDDSCMTVTSVGMWVLSEEIAALKMEGEALGDKFGGWEAIMEQVEDFVDGDTEDEGSQDSIEEEIAVKEEETKEEVDEMIEDKEEIENVVVDAAEEEETRQEAIEKFKELSLSLQNVEKDLEDAVAEEDFDKAAELDELLQQVQNKIEALGLSSEDLEALDNVANHGEEMTQPIQDDAPVQDADVEEEEVPTKNTEEIEVDEREDDTTDDGVVVDVEEATVSD